jgi:hypothetical protein
LGDLISKDTISHRTIQSIVQCFTCVILLPFFRNKITAHKLFKTLQAKTQETGILLDPLVFGGTTYNYRRERRGNLQILQLRVFPTPARIRQRSGLWVFGVWLANRKQQIESFYVCGVA